MFVAFLLMPASAFGVAITYDLNGGQLPNGDTIYQIDSSNAGTVLDNPTRDGYIFAGWCAESDYTAATSTCSNRLGLETITNGDVSKTMVRWTVPDNVANNTTYIALWEEDKFQIKTTNNTDEFVFSISASGNFWVDWGDGNIEYINKNNTDDIIYSHTYTTTASYVIHFGGLATGYIDLESDEIAPAITFSYSDNNNADKVLAVTGSLGAIFPTLHNGANNTDYPIFVATFAQCTSLTSIPSDLFRGVSGSADYMFANTFWGCTSLKSIPSGLFSGVSGAAEAMFSGTFMDCTSLTSLPNSLFPNITSAPTTQMFSVMFYGCTNLSGYVPATLFGNMNSNNYSVGPMEYIFGNTNLNTSCPVGTRQYLTGFEDDWYLDENCTDPNDSNCGFAVSCIADNGVLCQAGEYRDENGVCAPCPIGYYCASVPTVYTANNTGATQCGENATTPALGATECKCNYSMVWNAENNECNCPQSNKTWTDMEVSDGYLHDFGNGNKACVSMMMSAADTEIAGACIDSASPEESATCDWTIAGLKISACKYDGTDYNDCSQAIGICKSEDMAPFFTEELPVDQMMTVMGLSSDTPGWDWDTDFFVNNISSYNGVTHTVLSANSYNMCCAAGEYMLVESGVGTCTACADGYYCPGGGFTTNETAGLENCPEHQHPNANGSACECDTNYTMDENTGVCTVVCPATGNHYTHWEDDGSGIMEYLSGNSYDNTVANCVTMRMYVNDNSYIQGENPTAADYAAAGGRVAFCKYNTSTGYYDGACTKAYTMCEDDDIATMMGSLATGGIIPLINTLAGLTGNINYNTLFTQPSDNVVTEDRCIAITCLAGTYLDTYGAEYACSNCPEGFWCPGGAWVSGLTTDQGKNQCPTAGDSIDGLVYTSAAGSDAITDCYANCPSTPNCVANVANTSGNCSYVDNIATVSDTPVKYYGGTCATKFTNCNAGYSNPPTDITSWIEQNLESMNYVRMCTLDRNICNNFNCQGQDWCPTLHGGEFFGHIENGPITNVYGIASCNAFDSSTPVADRNFAPTATGVHCWVKLTKIDDMEIGTSGWIHRADYNSVNECSSECFDDLSLSDANDLPFLNALIASAYGNKVCTPNDISIAWDGVENAGNAGMCTYGGNLTTPTAGPTVLPDYCSVNGCTFLGWVVQTTSGTSGGS